MFLLISPFFCCAPWEISHDTSNWDISSIHQQYGTPAFSCLQLQFSPNVAWPLTSCWKKVFTYFSKSASLFIPKSIFGLKSQIPATLGQLSVITSGSEDGSRFDCHQCSGFGLRTSWPLAGWDSPGAWGSFDKIQKSKPFLILPRTCVVIYIIIYYNCMCWDSETASTQKIVSFKRLQQLSLECFYKRKGKCRCIYPTPWLIMATSNSLRIRSKISQVARIWAVFKYGWAMWSTGICPTNLPKISVRNAPTCTLMNSLHTCMIAVV